VLEGQAVEAAVGGRARGVEQRRVAFAQRDDAVVLAEKRDELAVAPDAALIERPVREPALPPELFQIGGTLLERVCGFEQTAAARAVIDDFGNRVARAARGFETNQFGRHDFRL